MFVLCIHNLIKMGKKMACQILKNYEIIINTDNAKLSNLISQKLEINLLLIIHKNNSNNRIMKNRAI